MKGYPIEPVAMLALARHPWVTASYLAKVIDKPTSHVKTWLTEKAKQGKIQEERVTVVGPRGGATYALLGVPRPVTSDGDVVHMMWDWRWCNRCDKWCIVLPEDEICRICQDPLGPRRPT